MAAERPEIRVLGHGRPRGFEAAGQTGLERASGELVFIQESDGELIREDLQRLIGMAEDDSVVAARTESRHEPVASPLLRRLRAWGTDADYLVDPHDGPTSPLQMVRRPKLQQLAGPKGNAYRLESRTFREKNDSPRMVTGTRSYQVSV